MDDVKNKYAFISYNHKDVVIAKWLQRKLESYKLPTTICNEFEDSRYLRPIFRDNTDLNSGVLINEIRNNLKTSKFLIIICSPNSYNSKWVNDEVRAFVEWGRIEEIIPFIIDGTPNSGDPNECIPLYLSQHYKNHPENELLGINLKTFGKEQSFIRVVSRMLGLSFDELWKRHERQRRKMITTSVLSLTIVLLLFYYLLVPISLTINIVDDKHSLPIIPDVQITVNNSVYPLEKLDTLLLIKNLPGYYRGQAIKLSFTATYYKNIEKDVYMNFGVNDCEELLLQRDSSFAMYSGRIVNEEGMSIPKASVKIDGIQKLTDELGRFEFYFPTEQQSEYKSVEVNKEGFHKFIRLDECPSENLGYILKRE